MRSLHRIAIAVFLLFLASFGQAQTVTTVIGRPVILKLGDAITIKAQLCEVISIP